MSDDKQLTVAELLARAGKEDSDADGTSGGRARSGKEGSEKPRRRRRRSMEDGGGVSVAELTGSFPKVKAKPKESKHGSPIDEPDGQGSQGSRASQGSRGSRQVENAEKVGNATKAAKETASKAESKTASPAESKAEPKAPQKAAPNVQHKAAANAPQSPSGQTVVRKKSKTVTVGRKADDQASGNKASSSANKAAEPAQTNAGQPTAKPGTPAPESTSVQGKPANKATQQEPSVDKSAATKSATKRGAQTSPAADETAEISRVTDKSDSNQAASSKQQDAESTGEIPKVTDSPSNTAKQGGTASASTRERRQADDDTSEIQSVPDSAAQDAVARRHEQAPVYAGGADLDDQDESVSEGEGMNPVAVILLALAGIVLGVVVFKGFEMLWDALNNYLVAALAVGVTGVMAGIVHALRTERDGLSMTLAVIVGLLLTFGPAVLVL
ncbi:hypothetical protein NLL45_10555 [Corynebacterium propinquum]|uniref:Uncharacterized protein n=1 Tax=Corynebacterium propinquum TaxID=43769 RepID=A0AAP4F798_9CORY|nr:hypothetical protein [Corynebacterium propinquum]MDK4327127.1 hypothetical protein [Corynebacterium propinquum]WKS28685.1 hypothetical protein NLL49_05590 [Corynebacterium propinquum]WKS31913.1 hypothetical protein NLL45_10555 [Corynebacterium propinquum]WKS33436.1 hypothetical protein NLL50_06825 [Corynebacterium propinquum]WKS36224.1 hypothetical protein NLL30_10515 [Corynebacterium propinquum]